MNTTIVTTTNDTIMLIDILSNTSIVLLFYCFVYNGYLYSIYLQLKHDLMDMFVNYIIYQQV